MRIPAVMADASTVYSSADKGGWLTRDPCWHLMGLRCYGNALGFRLDTWRPISAAPAA